MIHLEISDPGAMEQAARGFTHSADVTTSTLKTQIRVVDRGGSPWGGDAAGQAFWSVYREAAALTVAGSNTFGSTGDPLYTHITQATFTNVQIQGLSDKTTATLAMYQANEEEGVALSRGASA